MKLIDTHAHLYSEEFQCDLSRVVMRAKEACVEKVLLPNIDESTRGALQAACDQYPDFFFPMMGLHPTSVKPDWQEQLDAVYEAFHPEIHIAVGEIGIDLYWDTSLQNAQTDVFEEQLRWSNEKDLPVSIHFRNATREVIDCIKRVGVEKLRGVFHSFGGSTQELEMIMQLKNFYIGINGVITFKNSGLAGTLKNCPRDKVLLETDAPYLAPVPFRGKRNESAHMSFILNKLAEVWNVCPEEVANITSKNANELFGFGNNK
ncbi:MAG: TatD family hydrolase [Porphyromonadaceae bacterium]|nr:TatD family hydrolase [Porphyromonadaceae bacterium]